MVAIAYFGKEFLFSERQKNTSDSEGKTENIEWAGDGYLGYSFLRTVEMKKQLARKGLSLSFHDDNGDYATRLKKFSENEYDFIVLPINSFLEHGGEYEYPGVIVSGICESRGADALVGFEDVLPNGKINDLNNSDLIIYYTGASPSSFLLDLTISDFALDELKEDDSWRRELGGSEEVYKIAQKASKNREIGDAFVMWEPEVTKSIQKLGMKKLWGSDQFKGYIIDVVVFHRDYVLKNPEKIKIFLKVYFRVLNHYSSRNEEMIDELSKIAGIDDKVVGNMIENIDWYTLHENCSMLFDIPLAIGMPSNDGIINSIFACSDVMNRMGKINDEFNDPYLLLNSTFLEELKDIELNRGGDQNSGKPVEFSSLTLKEWMNLVEIGTMRVNPITFQSGTSLLDFQGEEIVDKVAGLLINNYPEYRIIIKGHTGKGDEIENKKLSMERAKIVKQRLIAVHSIQAERLHAAGYGAKQAPNKKTGENPRAYSLRWARVEFVLVDSSEF